MRRGWTGSSVPKSTQSKSTPPKNMKKQVKRTEHGTKVRYVFSAGEVCEVCKKIHEYAQKEDVAIFPRDPRFCTFIWNAPPPPTPPWSKNQARLMNGTRTGPRKSRKRNAKGQIRQPNDWVMEHIRNLGCCAKCNMPLYMFAHMLGNRKGRIVMTRGETEERCLMYAIWVLTKKVWEMYRIGIQSDVVHIILHYAFTIPVLADQRLKRDQFHSPCGCKYHLRCYAEYVAAGRSSCQQHKKSFP